MGGAAALLDTNVVVAALVDTHEHHAPSLALFEQKRARRFCIAAHSYAEAYVTLTREGGRGFFRRAPEDAIAALESIAAITDLAGPTPAQSLDAVRSYAGSGGIGPRLYDYLIGQAAAHARAGAILTWNARHFRALFPDRIVETPDEYLARAGRP